MKNDCTFSKMELNNNIETSLENCLNSDQKSGS